MVYGKCQLEVSVLMSPENLPRRHDIDRLRIFAMLVVFFSHCIAVFGDFPWYVENPEKNMGLTLLVGFIDIFQMPLFFLISGAGSFHALRHYSRAQYIGNRVPEG